MRNEQEHWHAGTHTHKIDWHVGHWVHDPRFWAAVVLIAVFALMILTAIFYSPGTGGHTMPASPYTPYLP